MAPAVVGLLTLRPAFSSDEEYLSFCDETLGDALSSLATAVGKDLLWKSVNHKVLLACRDPRQSVRQAATAVLHKLFSEVRYNNRKITIVSAVINYILFLLL